MGSWNTVRVGIVAGIITTVAVVGACLYLGRCDPRKATLTWLSEQPPITISVLNGAENVPAWRKWLGHMIGKGGQDVFDLSDWVRKGKEIPGVESVVLELLRTGNPEVRRESAIAALGYVGSDRSLDTLVEALKDSDPTVRAVAARSLGMLRLDDAVGSLEGLALHDPDTSVRLNAIEALADVGDPNALRALRGIVESEGDPVVVSYAQEALDRAIRHRGPESGPGSSGSSGSLR